MTHLVTGFAVIIIHKEKAVEPQGAESAEVSGLTLFAGTLKRAGQSARLQMRWERLGVYRENNHGSKKQRWRLECWQKCRYLSQASSTHITGNPWCPRWTPTMEIPGVPLRFHRRESGKWTFMEQTPSDGGWHTHTLSPAINPTKHAAKYPFCKMTRRCFTPCQTVCV